MVKLFCAVVSDPGAFPIDISLGESPGDLKEAIRTITMNQFPADELQLFLANTKAKNAGEKNQKEKAGDEEKVDAEKGAWLSSKSAAAMELEWGIVGQDIQALTAGKPMDPTLSIQDVLDENHMPVPQMEQIHVLAVPPVISTTSKPTWWLEKVKIDVKSAIRKERPDVFVIPRCSPSKTEELVEELGYENEAIDVVEDEDSSIDPYRWESDLAEDHEDQRKGYMQYLKDNLRGFLSEGGSATIPPGTSTSAKPKYYLKDTSRMTSLLDLKTSRLPFGLEGTADLMIIGEVAHSMNDIFADLQFVIKIKKNQCGAKERKELLLELVAANWKSYSPCAPIGLLSNLNDYWYFMWFTPDRKIARMKLSCPANGFKAMKDFLVAGTTDNASRGVYPMRVRFLSSPLPKRQKVIKKKPDEALRERNTSV